MPQVTATIRRSLLLAVAFVVAALALWASPAAAHAELLASDPADGSVLDAAPSAITLQFTEGVAVQPDGVRVLDDEGERVDAGTATATGSSVEAPIDDGLAQGSYVVAWRVISADGHPVRGAFTFSVGKETELGSGLADQAFATGADRPVEVFAAALRIVGSDASNRRERFKPLFAAYSARIESRWESALDRSAVDSVWNSVSMTVSTA